VATFSLCLLAQAYELASSLVFQIADIEVTVNFLMQIDKLVQLLESPIFIHLRLQLLEADRYPFLLKSLYGLLMLLPQSGAFGSLKTRLSSVAALSQVSIPESEFAVSNNSNIINATGACETQTESKQLNFRTLLQQFHTTQQKHQRRRKTAFHHKSLMLTSAEENEKKVSTEENEKKVESGVDSSSPGSPTAAQESETKNEDSSTPTSEAQPAVTDAHEDNASNVQN
jgi:vacuole morphology and inheritance protein 14